MKMKAFRLSNLSYWCHRRVSVLIALTMMPEVPDGLFHGLQQHIPVRRLMDLLCPADASAPE